MSVSHFVTFRTTCRDAREYHIAYLTAKLLYKELCHAFGHLQVVAAILVVIDNLTVKNCVHSYVLDAWRKISQETNQFLVFLTFDVNIHCVHTALWFCFPFVKSFRTVIGKFFLFYKVQTNQYSKSSVDNTLFKEKEDCLLRTTCQFGDGCNNFAEKSSLNHK